MQLLQRTSSASYPRQAGVYLDCGPKYPRPLSRFARMLVPGTP